MLGLACRQLHAVQLVDAAAPCVGSQEATIEAGKAGGGAVRRGQQ